MKKILIKMIITFAATAFVCLARSGRAEAAVKTMPDGGLFDPSFYAATYDDVYNAFGMNEALLYQHYRLCGIREKRLPYAGYVYPAPVSQTGQEALSDTVIRMQDGMLFDPVYYAKKNPDVVAAMGNDPAALYAHYVFFGMAEGRLPYEGYDASLLKLSFSTGGAIADAYTPDDIINALRQAAKYRVTSLKLHDHWSSGVSADQLPAFVSSQTGYLSFAYGVKSVSCTKPLVYGDVTNLIIETDVTLRY